jgi:hypothetical protein
MTTKLQKEFLKNVFINCPFDRDYASLLRPLVFTIVYLGFNPQIALESSDSGQQRVDKILSLIKKSRYSIHDLSRTKSGNKTEFCRLNMPFELGVDYGCRRISVNHLRTKKFLLLEKQAHDYQKALSDLSGVDIKNHRNIPFKAVQAVRNWFVDTVRLREVDSPSAIWDRFNEFSYDFYKKRKAEGFSRDDLNMMPLPEYIEFIKKWIISSLSR